MCLSSASTAPRPCFPNEPTGNVGKVVRMNGTTWEIIGVIEKRKAALLRRERRGQQGHASLSAPPARSAPQREYLLQIIQAKPGQLNEASRRCRRHSSPAPRNVKYGEPNNFDIKTADEFIEQFDSITAMVGLIAIAISSLGLLVGGIGVMNIMLVSVTERTKEIGIRKAIGATKGAIVLQFLLEAMTLTFFGGIIGVVLAVGISNLIMLLMPSLPASIPLGQSSPGLPSRSASVWSSASARRKASRLDPIECLRYE